jgi:hypothetical protein
LFVVGDGAFLGGKRGLKVFEFGIGNRATTAPGETLQGDAVAGLAGGEIKFGEGGRRGGVARSIGLEEKREGPRHFIQGDGVLGLWGYHRFQRNRSS